MYRYLNELNLLSIVKQQPKGLDAVIGQDMVLSGGEAQRLAIARALYRQRLYCCLMNQHQHLTHKMHNGFSIYYTPSREPVYYYP